jgi:hypothetical protein
VFWAWLARGRFTRSGVLLVAVGLIIPALAMFYVHRVARPLGPTRAAKAAVANFMSALGRQDVAAEQQLLAPDASAGAREFVRAPFAMSGFVYQDYDSFWGYRYRIVGHPGVTSLRLVVSCASNRCGIQTAIVQP